MAVQTIRTGSGIDRVGGEMGWPYREHSGTETTRLFPSGLYRASECELERGIERQ